MEEFSLDNILDDTNTDFSDIVGHLKDAEDSNNSEEKNKENNTITEEEDEEDSSKTTPESVGNEDDDEIEEDAFDDEQASPNNEIFFSSIAQALSEEGILPDLDSDTIKEIKTSQDLRNAVEEQIKSEVGETIARVQQALNDGMPAPAIKRYEELLHKLNTISPEALEEESEAAENVRKSLIYQDFINRGFTEARAKREMEKSVSSGNDIEDAKEALQSNIEFYSTMYNNELQSRREAAEQQNVLIEQAVDNLKKDIMREDNSFFGEISPDKKTRKKIFDNISKPTYKDSKTGNVYTEIQRYELENPTDFITKVGVLYTLTDGFKNLDKLVQSRVKKEVKRGFRDLESKINNTSRDAYGNLKYASGTDDESYFGKGLKFDF